MSGGLPLGALVAIDGIVVGRSEFKEGPQSYLIEFDRRGRVTREWFIGSDLVVEDEEDERHAAA